MKLNRILLAGLSVAGLCASTGCLSVSIGGRQGPDSGFGSGEAYSNSRMGQTLTNKSKTKSAVPLASPSTQFTTNEKVIAQPQTRSAVPLASPSTQFATTQTVVAQPQKSASANHSNNVSQVSFNSPTFNSSKRQTSLAISSSSYPVDFPTVLLLAGADNWNVRIAQERVREAAANYCEAKNAWMPSLTFSLGYNSHEGELQATEGDVLQVSRSSFFAGAGAGIQNSPLNGGSGGPPRMFVDFSLADAIFKPLAARRLLGAERAKSNRVFDDTMLQASLAYYDLVRAQTQLAIAQSNLADAQQVAMLTNEFVAAGKGTGADSNRIAVIVNSRQQESATAMAELGIASARLATILQLDPAMLSPENGLVALDQSSIPLNLLDDRLDLNSAISQAQSLRYEIAEANATAWAAQSDMQAEQWRPWLPNLYMGYSGGVFGGGPGGNIGSLDSRSDLDLVLSWQVKNMGLGTRARQDSSHSRVHQRNFEMHQIRDQVAEQVSTTYQRVNQFQSMIPILEQSIQLASDGLEKNLEAIKGLEGLPLEAVSSLEQLAKSRSDYADAVINYNQWQLRFLRAAGMPLGPEG